MFTKYRYHLEDKGQDLIHLDVEVDDVDGLGSNVSVPQCCAYGELFIDMAFNENDNKIGKEFNYADPWCDFIVKKVNYKVKSIEKLS